MRIFNLLLIFGLILICFITSKAQTDSSRRTVTVIYSKVQYNRTTKDREVHNLIKINPLLVFNGDFPLYFEMRVKDQLSVEGAVGVTYNDYLYEIFCLADSKFQNEDRKPKIGYSLAGALKFYPSKYTKALDEFYFGVEVRYRHYASQIPDDGGNSIFGNISESRNLTDFKFIVGYINYISDRVILEYYGGIGLRQRNISMGYSDYNVNTSTYQTKLDATQDMVPAISMGLKFGFGW